MMTRAEMEQRRLRGAEMIRAGKRFGIICRELRVSRETLSRWKRARRAGKDLRARKAPGRPSRLSCEQQALLAEMLRANPRLKQGVLVKFIEAEFGVHYDYDHVWRLKQRLCLANLEPAAGTGVTDAAAT